MARNPFPGSAIHTLPLWAGTVGGQINFGIGGRGSTSQPGSNVFYVNSNALLASNGVASNGRDPLMPFSTLNYALTQTVSNNGDIIICMPGHVETVTAAAGLTFPTATANGVTVYFSGNETDRAYITFTTLTTASVTIPANNVTLVNPLFVNAIDALATGVSVTGTDLKVINGEWRDGVALNTLIGWISTNAAKRISVLGYRYYEDKTGGGTQKTEHIRIVGGDHHRFSDVHVTGDFSTACWNNITTLSTELLFERCSFNDLNTTPKPAIAILTTSTGVAFAVNLTVASGSTWLTASNKISFDGASNACVPGGAFAHPNG